MKQYGLGPNGGILTSLNLFATRFDQVTLSLGAHTFTTACKASVQVIALLVLTLLVA